jgi:hypothetical protein
VLRRVIKTGEKGVEEIKLDADEPENLADIDLDKESNNEFETSESPEVDQVDTESE